MNILYVSCLCSLSTCSHLFPDVSKMLMLGQAVQKYHRLLVEGLSKHNDVVVNSISNYPINRSNCSVFYLPAKSETVGGMRYKYLGACNIPILKNIWNLLQSFVQIWKGGKKESQTVVICDILNISISMGALLAAKLRDFPTVGIVTDLPVFVSKKPNSFGVKLNTMLMNSFDSYVLLTPAMTEMVNCTEKPYTIIEGQVDINMNNVPNRLEEKYEKKICIYAGSLQKKYGIFNLAQAFLKANIDNAELHFYGSGEYQEELITLCSKYPTIRYLGVKPNAEVIQEELRATLLINPRLTNEEYTKYSFPSKNMEYMVSGTPVLTTNLPGMPDEYRDYVYLFEDETVEGMKKKLEEVLSISKEELHAKGLSAKEFVLKEKNNVVQVKKILEIFKIDKE